VRTILILAVLSTLAGAAGSPAVAQPAEGQVYKPGNGVTLPVLVKDVKPTYTPGAMRRGVQGMVGTSCVVMADGKVGDCTVTRSLDAELDEEAVRVAKQWQFKPGTKDGKPVPVEISIEMSFTLRGGPPMFRPGAGVSSPAVVTEVKPDYPDDVMQAGINGTVELEGVVQIDGSIDTIRVTKGLDERLDREAVKALGQWRFKPGQKDGQDVRVLISVEMTFSVR
jgi:TonB family protein